MDLRSELRKMMFALDDEALEGVTLKSARRCSFPSPLHPFRTRHIVHARPATEIKMRCTELTANLGADGKTLMRAGCWKRDSILKRRVSIAGKRT
jgi:hypothetical protein